jgi:mannosyltransferase
VAAAGVTARTRVLVERSRLDRRYLAPAGVVALVALSFALRSGQLGAGFWIDEGISVGIAHHHWTSIPHLLRQDGSPPLYYMLLGLWIRVFGDSERATHALSLLFALACIPLGYATARTLFDRRAALICAALVAFDPFLTYYGQETRMYALEAFLSLLVALAYVNGIVRGQRPWAAVLVAATALMVYTHNWGLFLCLALAVTTAVFVRERLRLFAVVAAAVAVLYLPWVPTVLAQVRHTGAPWSSKPSFHELLLAPGGVLGGDAPYVVLVLAAAAGLALVARRTERALAGIVGVAILAAWVVSQVSPAWTTRYFAVILGPVVLLAAAAIARAGKLGAVALVLVLFLWWGYNLSDNKEDARQVAAAIAPGLHPGELVISTHPEQVPVLRYYLGGGLRFATTLGPVPDPRVFDWRDVVDRLKAAQPRPTLAALLTTVPRGQEFVVVTPVFRDYRAWDAPWTRLVWQRSTEWTSLLGRDSRLRLERHVAIDEIATKVNYFKPLQVFVYRRVG